MHDVVTTTVEHEHWLTLSEAANLLGVHPTTLRSWADAGQIQMFRTPGGHRRFAEADIRRFLHSGRTLMQTPAADALASSMLQHARADLAQEASHGERWLTTPDEAERRQRRESGKRLLALTIQYLVRERGREEIVAEGRQIGAQYGATSAQQGLSLTDTTRAFFFFRESMSQAIRGGHPPTGQVDADVARIESRLKHFMDEVLFAALDAYESARLTPPVGHPI